jgi:hypothetical protein
MLACAAVLAAVAAVAFRTLPAGRTVDLAGAAEAALVEAPMADVARE